MQIFMILFITLSFGIAFANGVPASAGNSYDEKIKSNIDKAVNIAVDQALAKASNQGLIGSALNGLVVFLKSLLIPYIVGISNIGQTIKAITAGALKGVSKGLNDGHLLTGILGELAKAFIQNFQEVGGKLVYAFLKGSDPKKNEEIKKYIDEALKQAIAKLDAEDECKSDFEANLNNVKQLVNLLLRFVTDFVSKFLSTVLGSGIKGLVEGLSKGLCKNDLLGGVLGGAKDLFDGLDTGSKLGFGKFFDSLLSLSDK